MSLNLQSASAANSAGYPTTKLLSHAKGGETEPAPEPIKPEKTGTTISQNPEKSATPSKPARSFRFIISPFLSVGGGKFSYATISDKLRSQFPGCGANEGNKHSFNTDPSVSSPLLGLDITADFWQYVFLKISASIEPGHYPVRQVDCNRSKEGFDFLGITPNFTLSTKAGLYLFRSVKHEDWSEESGYEDTGYGEHYLTFGLGHAATQFDLTRSKITNSPRTEIIGVDSIGFYHGLTAEVEYGYNYMPDNYNIGLGGKLGLVGTYMPQLESYMICLRAGITIDLRKN